MINKVYKPFFLVLLLITIAITIYLKKTNFNQEPSISGGPSTCLWIADGKVLSINLSQNEITLQLEKECNYFNSMEVTFDYSNLTDVTINPEDLKVGQKINFSCFQDTPNQLYRIYEIYI